MVLGLAEVLAAVAETVPRGHRAACEADLHHCIRALARAINDDAILPDYDRWSSSSRSIDDPPPAAPKPDMLWREITSALTLTSNNSTDAGLKRATSFVSEYMVRHRVRHTAVETIPLVLEGMRAEGHRTMKKWRPWQAHKSVDRISEQKRFMFSTSGHGAANFVMVENAVIPDVSMDYDSIEIEIKERLQELVNNDEKSAALLEAVYTMSAQLVEGTFKSRLNGVLVFLEDTFTDYHVNDDIMQWASLTLGTCEDYIKWRQARVDKQRADRDLREAQRAGHDPSSERQFLRADDFPCVQCGEQMVLVSEQLRRADEAADWFRICRKCGVRRRQ